MAETNQKPKHQTLLELLDAVPPFLAYALARDPKTRKWRNLQTLVAESGLPERTVVRVGAKISWKGVKAEVMSAFLRACGINARNPLRMDKNNLYIRRTMASAKPFPYLSYCQWKAFERRCAQWKKARAN